MQTDTDPTVPQVRDQVVLGDDALSFITNVLIDLDQISATDLAYFLSKPWKWQGAFELWARFGKPTSDAFPEMYLAAHAALSS